MGSIRAEKKLRCFSAKQAHNITGVSQSTQRNWRRAGYLPRSIPGKKVRFRLFDLCILALIKAQVDAGTAVGDAYVVAKMSAPVAMKAIERCPFAIELKGFGTTKRDEFYIRNKHRSGEVDYKPTRYLFFPDLLRIKKIGLATLHSGSVAECPPVTCYHFATLAEMEKEVANNWVLGQIFDLEAFAMSLALADPKGGPLITYFAVENEDE